MSASPAPAAIGVTDYLSIENYLRMLEYQASGAVPAELFLFPNVEFRFTERADEGSSVNAHLLIDPTDDGHVDRIREAMANLRVARQGETISCTPDGLRRLGALLAGPGAQQSPEALYAIGNEQFKVPFDDFRRWRDNDKWLRSNSLVGVSLKTGDGSSGLTYRQGSNRSVREEIESYADVFFSARPGDREFWLGRSGKADASMREARGMPKPCIHGCDAHDLASVLNPDQNRFTWIKAEPTFDGLRQILFEPEHRVYIGDAPPGRTDAFSTIRELRVTDPGGRFTTPSIGLNPGLVAVIGQKGSGKTALADAIALATQAPRGKDSFLERAGDLLEGFSAEVVWSDGHSSEVGLDDDAAQTETGEPQIRYLSQQFVEELCSDRTPASKLRREIEDVIFQHVPGDQTLGTTTFADLRRARSIELAEEGDRLTGEIDRLTRAIADSDARHATVPSKREAKKRLEAQLGENQKEVEKRRPGPAEQSDGENQKRLAELQTVTTTLHGLEARLTRLDQQRSQAARLLPVLDAAIAEAGRVAGEAIVELEHIGATTAGLQDMVQEALSGAFRPLRDLALTTRDAKAAEATRDKSGGAAGPSEALESLRARKKLLEDSIDVDKRQVQALVELHVAGLKLRTDIQALGAEIEELERLPVARQRAAGERFAAYEGFFHLLAREREVLHELYAPLCKSMAEAPAMADAFTLEITTVVDFESWLARGLELFDNRRSVRAPIVEGDTLASLVRGPLKDAWSALDGPRAREGVEQVVGLIKSGDPLPQQLKTGVTPRAVAEWLFSTTQIRLEYDIHYGGTALWNLSPGTRGIALLLLYLGTDIADTRPLVVDQPDENLDNQSIYGLLRPFLLEARTRRQVIVITHNPNLVVGADADQVIVASSSPSPGDLPLIAYQSGALESRGVQDTPAMRQTICALMEGGEEAFLARERRYAPMQRRGRA